MNRLEVLRQAIQGSVQTKPFTKIIVQRQGKIGIIWLNSPKELNSLSPQMTYEIKTALLTLDNDTEVKTIVLRSKHEKVFCAGADIKHMKEHDYATYPYTMHFLSVINVIRTIRKPIIAVVEGKALGGGFQLALLTDIIIASKNASFALPQINLGLIPGMGGTQILTRIVGTKVASRLILSGQPITAQEAHRLQIAHFVLEQSFQQQLGKLLNGMVSRSTDSLQSCKKAINLSQQTTLEQGLEHQTTITQRLAAKQSVYQGIKAFIGRKSAPSNDKK